LTHQILGKDAVRVKWHCRRRKEEDAVQTSKTKVLHVFSMGEEHSLFAKYWDRDVRAVRKREGSVRICMVCEFGSLNTYPHRTEDEGVADARSAARAQHSTAKAHSALAIRQAQSEVSEEIVMYDQVNHP